MKPDPAVCVDFFTGVTGVPETEASLKMAMNPFRIEFMNNDCRLCNVEPVEVLATWWKAKLVKQDRSSTCPCLPDRSCEDLNLTH